MRKRKWRLRFSSFVAGVAALSITSAASANVKQFCYRDAPFTAPQYVLDSYKADSLQFKIAPLDGQRILIVSGGFKRGDDQRFAQFLQRNRAVDEVWFASPGGSVAAGLGVGRILREKGLMVRIPSGWSCASSCSLAFLGGPLRAVDGHYGIHMFSQYYSPEGVDSNARSFFATLAKGKEIAGDEGQREAFRLWMQSREQSNAEAAAQLARYLVEMSASLEFLTGMFGWGHRGMCWVNKAGQRRYNVANIQ